ncbi:YdbL family protein [Desulfogranum japonicum]|uniref:YdbL family protein n=1 Tax=Desulfogranum japonicum TaxID=231447 RepID=UPI00040BA042|nr:YdbL family protein [Desulfogranum japonicum]
MKKIFLYFLVTLFFSSASIFAMDLQNAKQKGLVGETPSGYLQSVKPGNGEVDKLVQSINAARKKQYQEIAQKRNTSLQAVEKLAGKTAIEKTPAGQFIHINGKWMKK